MPPMDELGEKIESEIRNYGAISFARFMELALYCPVYGYYEKEGDNPGRRGDFYTSVSVGSLFGEMLGFQFARWFEGEFPPKDRREKRKPGISKEAKETAGRPWQIIEAGAHRGELARDILGWMRDQRPRLFAHLEYWIVEPSERRRQWQRQTLEEFFGKTHWAGGFHEIGMTGRKIPAEEMGQSRQDWARRMHRPPLPAPLLHAKRGRVPITDGSPAESASSASSCSRIIFSNELLDALPVHRLGWSAAERTWFEWGVTSRNGRFEWVRMAPNQQAGGRTQEEGGDSHGVWAALERLLESLQFSGVEAAGSRSASVGGKPSLGEVLPDGFTIELCPTAEEWWQEAASAVSGSDKLVAIDYGRSAAELFTPERNHGTLRAYRRHQLAQDVLGDPGQQDLTADVNFTALEKVGEHAGLATEALVNQETFLTGIASRIWKGEAAFGEWTFERTRQFQTLTHPEHLGRAFKVFVQTRP